MSWPCPCGYNNVVDGYDCLRCGKRPPPVVPIHQADEPYKYEPVERVGRSGPGRTLMSAFRAGVATTTCLAVMLGVSAAMLYVSKAGPFDQSCAADLASVAPKGAPGELGPVTGMPEPRRYTPAAMAADIASFSVQSANPDLASRKARLLALMAGTHYVEGSFESIQGSSLFVEGAVMQFARESCANEFAAGLREFIEVNAPTTTFDGEIPGATGLEISDSSAVPSVFIVIQVVKERVLVTFTHDSSSDDAAKIAAANLAAKQLKANETA